MVELTNEWDENEIDWQMNDDENVKPRSLAQVDMKTNERDEVEQARPTEEESAHEQYFIFLSASLHPLPV